MVQCLLHVLNNLINYEKENYEGKNPGGTDMKELPYYYIF